MIVIRENKVKNISGFLNVYIVLGYRILCGLFFKEKLDCVGVFFGWGRYFY